VLFGHAIIDAPYFGQEMLCLKYGEYRIPMDVREQYIFETRQWILRNALSFLNCPYPWTKDSYAHVSSIVISSLSPYYQIIGKIEVKKWSVSYDPFYLHTYGDTEYICVRDEDVWKYNSVSTVGEHNMVQDAQVAHTGRGRYYFKETPERRRELNKTPLNEDEIECFVHPGEGKFYAIFGSQTLTSKLPLGFYRVRVGANYYAQDENGDAIDNVEFRLSMLQSMLRVKLPGKRARWRATLQMNHDMMFGEMHVINTMRDIE